MPATPRFPPPRRAHRAVRFFAVITYTIALHAHGEPRVVSVQPSQIPYGHAMTVNVAVDAATEQTQLALAPGGAYINGDIAFANAKYVYVLKERNQVLVATARKLLLADATQELPRLIANLSFSEAIAQFTANDTLAALADVRAVVSVIDLQTPNSLRVAAQLQANGTIVDLAVEQSAVYALLSDGKILKADVTAPQPEFTTLGATNVAARQFTVRDGMCYVAAKDVGLVVFDCGTTFAERARFATSGTIRDLRVAAGIAYIADGPAGLTLIDVTQPDRPRLVGSNNKLGDVERVTVGDDRALVSNRRGDVTLVDVTRRELPLLVSTLRVDQAPAHLAWSGGDAWIATMHGAQRIDFSAEAAPLLSDEGVNLGGSRRAFIHDNILYVADWFSGLHMYDIADPTRLHHAGNFHTRGSSKGVVVRDGIAYVGDDDHGIQIVDVSDPARARSISSIPTKGLAYTMKLVGDVLYVADHRGGLQILDVHDAKHPKQIGTFDTPGKAWAVDVRDNVAFVADDLTGLLVFDVSDPKLPRLIGQYTPGGAAEDVRVRDNLAYVTFFDQGLFILDIANAQSPRVVGHIAIPGNARGVDLKGDLAFVAAWEAGLQIVDIHDPTQPRIVGYYDTDGSSWGVNVRDDYAFVLDWWGGVKSIDIRDPTRPRLAARYHARKPIQDIALAQRYALTVAGTAGLQIFDIKNSLNPIWVTGVDLPAEASGIAIAGDHAVVAMATGVADVNIHDPFTARLAGVIDVPTHPRLIRAAAQRVFMLDASGGAHEIDVAHKRITAFADGANDLWIDGKTLYLARGEQGLAMFALAPGKAPQALGTTTTANDTMAIRARDNVVAVALRGHDIALFRRNGARLELVATQHLDHAIRDLQLAATNLFVSTDTNEFFVFDISDPTTPRLKTRYATTDRIERFALQEGQVFFAGASKPTSLRLLPDTPFVRGVDNTFTATLPEDQPLGTYGIEVFDNAQPVYTAHNALRITLKTGKKPQLSHEEFQRLLQQQKANGAAK